MSRLRTRYTQLVKICRGRGCSREDAKDLIQEAHWRLIMYQRSARVTDADYLLRRILVNLAINHYHRVLSAPFTYEPADKLDRLGLLIVAGAGPERTLAAEQDIDRVVSALSAVSPRTCQIFLAHRGGYSYEEIALAFAIRPRTVEKHIATASYTLLCESGIATLPQWLTEPLMPGAKPRKLSHEQPQQRISPGTRR